MNQKKDQYTDGIWPEPKVKTIDFDDPGEGQIESQQPSGPVTVLGMTFASDDERRQYFRDELRKKLPELRHIEGFPIGEDDDIINLSDPPYFTACPNPWLNDFIGEWEQEKKQLETSGKRRKNFDVIEPYALPIKERKNSAIYNAHSYHTKVPHQIIMRYMLHYTQPGDVIFDGFAGTGMTGVAASELAYPVSYDFRQTGIWGKRNCILGDLSPFASFITANYNYAIDEKAFSKAANEIYETLHKELSWMYETKHLGSTATVNYYIWSEVQVCPHCGRDFVYWQAAVDFENSKVLNEYNCPNCSSQIAKKQSIKAVETYYDRAINETYSRVKYVPVVINYTYEGKRYERPVSDFDISLVKRIEDESFKYWFPTNSMMGKGEKWGDTWRAGYHVGFNHVHNFYTKRNLVILSRLYSLIMNYHCDDRLRHFLLVWFTSCQSRLHIMNRYAANHHRHVGPLANTLYVSGTPAEISPFYFIKSKIKDNSFSVHGDGNVVNQVFSATKCNMDDNSIDYIFTDPPFGGNIMYSELNYIYESWLKVYTNNSEEAITSESQHKSVIEYQNLMTKCFKEYYRVLKPGKWMTVEFSNTSAGIWNSIRMSLQEAGFVISFVSDLNKGRGGLHGIYSVVAVNQDLAITCYKPSADWIAKIQTANNFTNLVWDFIDEYLNHIPTHLEENGKTTTVVERSPKILYDRMISYYVQHGYPVPMDARSFQEGLRERYLERDGMFFTAAQAAEYEQKRKNTTGVAPMGIIVSDEANGIEWLRIFLRNTPKTYQDIQPDWMQAINGVRKNDILPELRIILEENFIEEPDGKWRLPNIQDDVDMTALRTRALLREFRSYVEVAQKPKSKIKEARVEALRAGFKQCYIDKDFETIVKVSEKIPQNLLQEDEVLLQFYDIALNKI